MNRRGFFAAMVEIPSLGRPVKGPRIEKLRKYVLSTLYGKFAEPTPEDLALIEDYKRHNAEIMQGEHLD